jgi:predicted enzyme related to lactoylglutathione lyase
MSNPFTYAELHTKDAAAAKAFYGQLFDWKIKDTPTPMGTYTEIDTGDKVPGGIFQPKEGGGSQWLPYILVGDVAASTVKAKRLGAQAIKENQEVPGMGRYSVLVDPTGATFGLWEKTAPQG